MKKILFILIAGFLTGMVPANGQTSGMSRADAERFMAYFYDSVRFEADMGTLQKIYPQTLRDLRQRDNLRDKKREGSPGGSRVIPTQSSQVSNASEDFSGIRIRKNIKNWFVPSYQALHASDYDVDADRERAKRLIKRFRQEADYLPTFYQIIDKKYKGDVDAYVDDLFDESFYGNEKRMKKFLKTPTRRKVTHDPAVLYTVSKSQYVTLIRHSGYDDLLVKANEKTPDMSRADAERFMAYFYDSIRYEVDLLTCRQLYKVARKYDLQGDNSKWESTSVPTAQTMRDYSAKELLDEVKRITEEMRKSDVYDASNLRADRERAKRLIRRFREEASVLPSFYQIIDKAYKGDVDAYVDDLFDNSFMTNERKMKKFKRTPTSRKLCKDPGVLYTLSKCQYWSQIKAAGLADSLDVVVKRRWRIEGCPHKETILPSNIL